MLSDFHVHTNFSIDSSTAVKQQIDQAITLGMKDICITDHHDYGMETHLGKFELDFPSYLPYMKEMQTVYADRIQVHIGVELGLEIHHKDYLETLIERYPLDFIIGSSHLIRGEDPFFPSFYQGYEEKDCYIQYFEATLKRILMIDCYDVFGHLDYVVRYGPNQNQYYTFSDYREYIDPILNVLIDKGKGLECNTGGYKYGLGHPNPCEEILIRYRELGGEILTVGSDAHATEYVGYRFTDLKEILVQCGFRYYTIFQDRKPKFIRI